MAQSLSKLFIHIVFHTKKMSFKNEYTLFLSEYGIDYNEDYFWSE